MTSIRRMIGLVVINILLIIGHVYRCMPISLLRIPYELMSAIIIVLLHYRCLFSETGISGTSGGHHRRAFSFLLRKLGFGVSRDFILGVVILGDLVETNFRNSINMSGNSLSIFT